MKKLTIQATIFTMAYIVAVFTVANLGLFGLISLLGGCVIFLRNL